MDSTRRPFELPARLDSASARRLAQALLERRHRAISVDASGVELISTLCVQVLLSARKCWQGDGLGFTIENPSSTFRDSIELLGAEILLR